MSRPVQRPSLGPFSRGEPNLVRLDCMITEWSGEQVMTECLATHSDPVEAGTVFWGHVADAAQVFAPLFFELSAAAMHRKPYATELRSWLATGWIEELAAGLERSGVAPDRAVRLARLCLGAARGVLLELAITGDRTAADAPWASSPTWSGTWSGKQTVTIRVRGDPVGALIPLLAPPIHEASIVCDICPPLAAARPAVRPNSL